MAKNKYNAPISIAKKNHLIDQAIKESLKNISLKEDTKVEEPEAVLSESSLNAMTKSIERKNFNNLKMAEKDSIFSENFKDSISKAFAYVVFESIPIAPDIKLSDKEYIFEESVSVFKALYEDGSVVIANSPMFKEFSGSIVKKIENENERLTPEQIDGIIQDIFTDDNIDYKFLTRNIYNKSVEAVKIEKEIISKRKSMIESDVYLTDKYKKENFNNTLFRSINEAVISNFTNESPELIKDLKHSDVLNLALAESLLHVTIMESLHTAKLAKFNYGKMFNAVKYL